MGTGIYCYECDKCSRKSEELRDRDKRNARKKCKCGGVFRRNLRSELVNSPEQDYRTPVLSDAMGVHPNQVQEHRRAFPDIPITDDGRVVCSSHANKKRHMKALGFIDLDGY